LTEPYPPRLRKAPRFQTFCATHTQVFKYNEIIGSPTIQCSEFESKFKNPLGYTDDIRSIVAIFDHEVQRPCRRPADTFDSYATRYALLFVLIWRMLVMLNLRELTQNDALPIMCGINRHEFNLIVYSDVMALMYHSGIKLRHQRVATLTL
jgi:hypothetical protein